MFQKDYEDECTVSKNDVKKNLSAGLFVLLGVQMNN